MRFWKSRRKQLQEEIQDHLELETRENVRSGMSPQEAYLAAQRKFGNSLLVIERSREMWGGLWFEYLLQDMHFALRSLLRAPGYTVAVVLTLAVGLGSVTTMLAVVDSVLLRPIKFPQPQQLVIIGNIDRMGTWGNLSSARSRRCVAPAIPSQPSPVTQPQSSRSAPGTAIAWPCARESRLAFFKCSACPRKWATFSRKRTPPVLSLLSATTFGGNGCTKSLTSWLNDPTF